ncbi:MAG: DUF47 family protein [Armatimonadota bacterium]|nr:DUF47 family protein [Armatimonadota bacterium]MDR7435966.1 DUF47 family protein [Armatimonadota bacterium]
MATGRKLIDQGTTPPQPPSGVPDRELSLLEEMVRTILEAAEVLTSAMEGEVPFPQAWQAILDLEHKGDAIARDLFDALMVPHQPPADGEALKALMGYLDDVLDAIEAGAARLVIYHIHRPIPQAREMARIVRESAQQLHEAVGQLRRMQEVFPHTRALHRLENRADDLLREGLELLFTEEEDLKNVLKWKDIFEALEASTDRCEDVANVLETLLIQTGGAGRLVAGRVVIDVDRHEVTVAGKPVALSTKEFGVLHLLLRHQGKVVRRERLLNEVWGEDYFGDTRTLDTHIGWLRKKLEAEGGIRIVTVRGIGYRLDLSDRTSS